MTPDEIRSHAAEVILDRARDVVELHVCGQLDSAEVYGAERVAACGQILDAVREATVTVNWPDATPADDEPETVEGLREAAGWIRDERDQTEAVLANVLHLLDRLDDSGQDIDLDPIRGCVPDVLAARVRSAYPTDEATTEAIESNPAKETNSAA